jgi:hypothetical protein
VSKLPRLIDASQVRASAASSTSSLTVPFCTAASEAGSPHS